MGGFSVPDFLYDDTPTDDTAPTDANPDVADATQNTATGTFYCHVYCYLFFILFYFAFI